MLRDETGARRAAKDSDPEDKAKPGHLEALVTVQRTMDIFEMLADQVEGLPISDIARELKVNKSIAFRILSSLKQAGYIYQSLTDDSYRLTFRLSNLGLRQQASARLTDQCFPIVRALADDTGELIRLAVVEDGKPIWVHAASGPLRRLRIDPVWPAQVVFHAHAVGKAWLSTLSDDEVARILGSGPFESLTPATKTELAEIMRDIQETRAQGYAMSYEESEVGVGAIAAPINVGKGGDLYCAAVLSIAAPTSRMNYDALVGASKVLLSAARELEIVWPLDVSRL